MKDSNNLRGRCLMLTPGAIISGFRRDNNIGIRDFSWDIGVLPLHWLAIECGSADFPIEKLDAIVERLKIVPGSELYSKLMWSVEIYHGYSQSVLLSMFYEHV